MQLKIVLRAGMPVVACAVAFCATEVWNTKVSSRWTAADANLILNNSPWAKQVKTKTAASGGARRGGMGRRRDGYPTGGRGGANNSPMSALVRWESAKPVQEAETRVRELNAPADSKPASGSADPFEKHYVVSVIGLRASGRQSGRSESRRDQLLTTTQLVRKNKTPIGPDDVKVKTEDGANEIQFFFPKTSPISIEDKEVTFHSVIGRMTVEDKFDLKKMTRSGRLELD